MAHPNYCDLCKLPWRQCKGHGRLRTAEDAAKYSQPTQCPCRKDENGCVIFPDLSCPQHKNLRHRLAGGEGL